MSGVSGETCARAPDPKARSSVTVSRRRTKEVTQIMKSAPKPGCRMAGRDPNMSGGGDFRKHGAARRRRQPKHPPDLDVTVALAAGPADSPTGKNLVPFQLV